MIDRGGRAILTDFGLARPENEAEHLTSDGVVLGTPSYMAPEQAAGQSDRVGPWTDLYSLGVVLFQMLTGRLPFEGPSLVVLNQIIHAAPPDLSALRASIDPALEAIVLRAFAKDPQGRYSSARQFAEALAFWSESRNPAVASIPASQMVLPTTQLLRMPRSSEEKQAGRAQRKLPWLRLLLFGTGLLATLLALLFGSSYLQPGHMVLIYSTLLASVSFLYAAAVIIDKRISRSLGLVVGGLGLLLLIIHIGYLTMVNPKSFNGYYECFVFLPLLGFFQS